MRTVTLEFFTIEEKPIQNGATNVLLNIVGVKEGTYNTRVGKQIYTTSNGYGIVFDANIIHLKPKEIIEYAILPDI